MEGTYPLPEAQLDRFLFKINLSPSDVNEMVEILKRTTSSESTEAAEVMTGAELIKLQQLVKRLPAPEAVLHYAARLIAATNPESNLAPTAVSKYLRFGSSPRGAQALVSGGKGLAFLAGRSQLSFDDVRAAAIPSLCHRMILNFEAEAEGVSPATVVEEIVQQVQIVGALQGLGQYSRAAQIAKQNRGTWR